jgi:hypothetical protein
MDIVTTVVSALQTLLGDYLDQLARDCGVVVRERKFTGQSLLRMLVLTLLQKPDADCWDFLVSATELGLDVSQTAVAKRLVQGQPLVDFLKQALQKALQQVVQSQPDCAATLQQFTAVFLGDSSTISLPDELAELFPGTRGKEGTSGAALKLQVRWDLLTGQIVQLLVEAGKSSDAKSGIAVTEVPKGALLIYDLGYFSVERFGALAAAEAFFVSRYQHSTAVADAQGQPLDLLAFLRAQPAGLVDVPIQLGASQQLSCRLIAVRVPEEIANRRRQEARRKARDHGREPSEEYLQLLGWSLFVTNCPAAQLSWKAVVVLYRARWQIEVLFKVWKSYHGLARLPEAPPLAQLTYFYAKLLGVLLQHWLLLATAWQQRQRSLLRAAKLLQEEWKNLLRLLDDTLRLTGVIVHLQHLLQRLAQVTARRKHPSHAQLLDDPDLLNWIP